MSRLLIAAILLCYGVKSEVVQNSDGSGSIRFEPPNLNDEESHSTHMPQSMKCDACKAIAFQFTQAFDYEHKKSQNKKLKELKESDVIRVVEEVCEGEQMKRYGVKEVDGVRMLSGPGLKTEDTPGIMQGGGRWPNRMERLCSQYVEEFEEDAIYGAYIKNPAGMENFMCENDAINGLTNVCLQARVKRKKKTEL